MLHNSPSSNNNNQNTELGAFTVSHIPKYSMDIARIFIKERFNRSAFEDGTPFRFSNAYVAQRWVGAQDEETTSYVAQRLATVCKSALGSVMDYPVMKGEGLKNKAVMMLYPRGSAVPCAFNVAFSWDLYDGGVVVPCIHYGLFIVVPDHQKKGLQAPLGFINIFLLWRHQKGKTVWMTDLGRSASGSRHFYGFMSHVYPSPYSTSASNAVDTESLYPAQLLVARELHKRWKRDTCMSPHSVLQGMAVKGSNGAGGAEALVQVNRSTGSRNKLWNDWINFMCPKPEDELIMVGQFLLGRYLYREVKKQRLILTVVAVALLSVALPLALPL